MAVDLTNESNTPEVVRLDVQHAEATRVKLTRSEVEVAPGATTRVPGRIGVKARVFGRPERFAYTVTARGSGAARRAEAGITTRAMLGANGPKAFAIIAIVALWAGLALVFIPKLADTVRNSQDKSANSAAGLADRARSDAPGADGNGGSGGSGGASGRGGSGGSGSGGSGGSGSASAKQVQFSGTVDAAQPGGVSVALTPTSLVDEQAQGARGIGTNTLSYRELGKIPGSALTAQLPSGQLDNRTTTTASDGAWAFAKVHSPGYYLVTFSKPGYQTQRFVVDSSSAAAAEPLKVDLQPGQGSLRGVVGSAAGRVGGAAITLTDGTNTVTTSTDSRGNTGAWSVSGLSTPASYLLTASKDGLSTESKIITLGAGGSASADLTLSRASATLVGFVRGQNSLGALTRLGGVSVTATNGTVSRTTTTVTAGNLIGTYRLPDLPPGTYAVTTSADGYLTQTQRVVIRAGRAAAAIRTDLTSSAGTVTGLVIGAHFDDNGRAITSGGKQVFSAVEGAGITLMSPNDKYKITTAADGTFRISGVVPGDYVLTAEYSGLVTAYASVHVVAGRTAQVPTRELTMAAAVGTDTSTITGFVSAEGDPDGAFHCPADEPNPARNCTIEVTLTDTDGHVVPTAATSGNGGARPKEYSATTLLPYNDDGPVGYTLAGQQGLAPGLYHLRFYTMGYLTGRINVRVPANSVAVAPQIALVPANKITGVLTARGNLATDGPSNYTDAEGHLHADPQKDPYKTCVWAVPNGSTFVPTTCVAPPATTTCKDTGNPDRGFALVTPDADGNPSYTIGNLCDGTYKVYVVPLNPWYHSPPVAFETVQHGQTVSYSPTVPNLGHVLLSVFQLQDDGTLTPAGPITDGTAACGGTSFGDPANAPNSIITIEGVPAGSSITCIVTGKIDGQSVYGRVSNLAVNDDRDTSADMTLTSQVGAVWGEAVALYGDSGVRRVGSVTFTGSATIDPDAGSTTPDPRKPNPQTVALNFRTDANGCFAIAPTNDPVPTGTAECGTIPSSAVIALPLVRRGVHLLHAQPTNGQSDGLGRFDGDVTLSAGQPPVQVRIPATPIPFTGLKLTTSGGSGQAPDYGSARLYVDPKQPKAQGSGSITVTSDDDGDLSWSDSALDNTVNVAVPGTYTIVAELDGYDSARATLTCPGYPSSDFKLPDSEFPQRKCTLGTFELKARAGLSGHVTLHRGPGTSASYPSDTPSAGSVVLTMTHCDGQQSPPGCFGQQFQTTTDGLGNYDFATATSRYPFSTDKWYLTVTADGYSTTSSFSSTVDFAGKGGLVTRNIDLAQNQVELDVGVTLNGTQYDCTGTKCAVTLTPSQTDPAVPAAQDKGMRKKFQPLNPGNYQVSITGSGFSPAFFQYTVPRGTTDQVFTVDFPVSQVNNSVSGSVTSSSTGEGLDDVPVELGTGTGANFTVANDSAGKPLVTKTSTIAGLRGQYQFTGMTNGTYTVRFNHSNSAGFAPLSGYRTAVSTTAVRVENGNTSAGQQVLERITRDVLLSITTTDAGDDISTASPSLTPSGGTAITPTPSAPTKSGLTYTWKFPSVPSGSYQVAIKLPPNRFGTPTGTTCVKGSDGLRTCTATAALDVSGDPSDTSTTKSVDFTLSEFQAAFSVVAQRLTSDPQATPPSTVTVTVTGSDGVVPISRSDFPVSDPAPAQPTASFYGASTVTYKVVVTPASSVKNWSTDADTTLSAASATASIALKERGSTVKITPNLPSGATADGDLTVKLTVPGGSGITGTYSTTTAPGSAATFTDVPFHTGWTVQVTGKYKDAQNASQNVNKSQTFDVTDTTTTVTVAIS